MEAIDSVRPPVKRNRRREESKGASLHGVGYKRLPTLRFAPPFFLLLPTFPSYNESLRFFSQLQPPHTRTLPYCNDPFKHCNPSTTMRFAIFAAIAIWAGQAAADTCGDLPCSVHGGPCFYGCKDGYGRLITTTVKYKGTCRQ